MSGGSRDYYDVLGVTREASSADIRRAFRSRARQFHPDSAAGGGDVARFQECSDAFAVLQDPARRAQYDVTPARRAQHGGSFTPSRADSVGQFVAGGSPRWSLSVRIVVSWPKPWRWLSWR
jgi:molecular chaperone DnaJ